jgi:N-6 DNA Methylase/HsdM N-terminal domain
MRAGKAWGSPASGRFFALNSRAIPLTVAYSAIFVTTGQEQHGESDEGPDGEGAKYGFGRLIGPIRARPVAGAKHGRSVVVVMAVEEHERMKALDAPGGRPSAEAEGETVTMALKKSELYSSLWSSCDELRGGMDASQYKDYVLVLLFIKYISDRYAGMPYAPITIPQGASFKDMVAFKGKSDVGDQINKKIIAPLANANQQLSQADFPDFNDAAKLGSGKEMVDRLTNLIAIFENPGLDFSKNRADGDDILGDAYEYLMRHFATESGKSKGQFYTPAEVSRIIAQILGIRSAKTSNDTTVYDPTCGSGSLLLKVADEARIKVTLYGQEKDAATSGLARMNMILHNNPTALIV